MSTSTKGLSPELLEYIREVSVTEHPLQVALRQETAELTGNQSIMQISPEQANFMQTLVRLTGARKCIEVGVFTGYSSLSVAMALPEDGVIHALDVSKEWTDIGRPYWQKAGVEDKIRLTLAPAAQPLQALINEGQSGTFDFVFIDADKPNYIVYYEQCLKLLKPGGLMLLDNTLWSGDVIDPNKTDDDTEGIRKINALVSRDDRVWKSLIPISDGVTLILKK